DRPVISTAAPLDLRSLLLALPRNPDASKLAEQCIVSQLKSWVTTLEETRDADTSLGKPLGVDLEKLEGISVSALGNSPASDAAAIVKAAAAGGVTDTKALWTWERLPYAVRCAGFSALKAGSTTEDERPKKKTRAVNDEQFAADVDEWYRATDRIADERILRNETYLRLLSRASKVKTTSTPWTFGLLRLQDVSTVVSGAVDVNATARTGSPIALKIPRAPLQSVPGFHVLDGKRTDAVYLQPSIEAFRARWTSLTGNLLDGLEWSNVCVAGGLVLGSLLTPDIPAKHPEVAKVNKPEEWKSSDIDLYIYGLDIDTANRKVKHIADTYKKNLPAGAPFLSVRNSQTITLYSAYPVRRVQIVLKLVSSPREVLLNFDLDIVAAAFDGKDVWMLPRCVRALESIVFKYANKGFGIRILPSYIAALSTYNTKEKIAPHTRGERLYLDLDLKHRADDARRWTRECINEYLEVGHTRSPFHWPKPYPPVKSKKPVFSHAMLESYAQVTSEPLGRSCLTGFTLFMRHVALWEEELAGRITIFEDLWATDTYGEGPLQEISYDDSPPYAWNESFTIEEFKRALDAFNQKEIDHTRERIDWQESRGRFDKPIPARRITYADTIDELLSPEKDIQIPVFLPQHFLDFANKLILEALRQAHPLSKERSDLEGPLNIEGCDPAVLWRLDCVLNWQMLDRTIDEVREALWAFHRAYERSNKVDPDHSINTLKTNLSRRAIRTSTEDEMDAFVRWVGRKPYHSETKLNAVWQMEEMGDGGDGGFSEDDGEEGESDGSEGEEW
ncbi:hypothetical protein EXIGLDRAFT_622192, partial [Exidia glandulosa HHB12029]